MAIICGIDEAGYGPLLGPLVVTAAAFRYPSSWSATERQVSWWRAFVSSPAAAENGTRFVVCDSKTLHRGVHGLRRLEEAIFPFLGLQGPPPTDVRSLLTRYDIAANELLAQLDHYLWYRGANIALPLTCAAAPAILRAETLRHRLIESGLELLGFKCAVTDVAQFNRAVAQSGNKGLVLWQSVTGLLRRLLEEHKDEEITALIDRQGGRMRYAPQLQSAFSEALVATLAESSTCSVYRLCHGRRSVTVRFEVGADKTQPVTALASMFSKYVRELLMQMFNEFWRQRDGSLTPTAGYYSDALRFLRDIEPLREALAVSRELLVRSR